MPITVVCDDCSKSHKVRDDAVGKRFPCKGCGKSLKIEVPILEVDDVEEVVDLDDAEEDELDELDDYEPAPRRSSPKRSKAGGRRASSGRKSGRSSATLGQSSVPLGMTLVYVGFVLVIFVLLTAMAVTWTAQREIGWLMVVLRILQVLAYVKIGASVITLSGKILCLTAPPRVPGKAFVVISALIDVIVVGLTILSHFQRMPRPVHWLIDLSSILGFVCFVLFLKELGHFLRESDIVERATSVLATGAIAIGFWVALIILVAMAIQQAIPQIVVGIVGLILALGMLVSGILGIIRYAGLLSTCGYALQRCD